MGEHSWLTQLPKFRDPNTPTIRCFRFAVVWDDLSKHLGRAAGHFVCIK